MLHSRRNPGPTGEPSKIWEHPHKCCAVKNNSINAGPSEVTVAYKCGLTARLINKL